MLKKESYVIIVINLTKTSCFWYHIKSSDKKGK